MIDREHDLSITKQAKVLKISRVSVYYLRVRFRPPTSRSCNGSTGCIRVSFRRFANVARPAGRRGVQDRPPAYQDAGAADGDSGALPSAAHHQVRTRTQDLSVSAARDGDPNQVWAMEITYIPMARGFFYLAVVLWRMPSLATRGRTFSIPTRARSSRALRSPACSPVMASPSAWMARTPGATTCSSSGCGAASNTRRSICAHTTPCPTPAPRSADTSTFYNGRRPHSSLDGGTPDQACFNQLPFRAAS